MADPAGRMDEIIQKYDEAQHRFEELDGYERRQPRCCSRQATGQLPLTAEMTRKAAIVLGGDGQ
jgi:hypothetical protein